MQKASSDHTRPVSAPRSPAIHQAMTEAQHLAFAPVSFMTAYCLRRMGLLDRLFDALSEGLTVDELAAATDLSPYAIHLLGESGLAIGALSLRGDRYHLTKLGHVLRSDPMTGVNFEFIYEVCYQGLFHLEAALRKGEPSGLKSISDATTVYEGLHRLAQPVKKAWLEFDHYYSDSAFAAALPHVFHKPLRRLMDVGGNTGNFTKTCLEFNADVQVTLCDLPQQVAMAQEHLHSHPGWPRLRFHGCDLLDEKTALPQGFDAIWMSQFLVCFDESTVIRILQRAHAALEKNGQLFILDTFWDRQQDPVAAFCLIQTSPYFTTIANGNSRIYRSDAMQRFAEAAGFKLQRIVDELGISHSLMIFAKS